MHVFLDFFIDFTSFFLFLSHFASKHCNLFGSDHHLDKTFVRNRDFPQKKISSLFERAWSLNSHCLGDGSGVKRGNKFGDGKKWVFRGFKKNAPTPNIPSGPSHLWLRARKFCLPLSGCLYCIQKNLQKKVFKLIPQNQVNILQSPTWESSMAWMCAIWDPEKAKIEHQLDNRKKSAQKHRFVEAAAMSKKNSSQHLCNSAPWWIVFPPAQVSLMLNQCKKHSFQTFKKSCLVDDLQKHVLRITSCHSNPNSCFIMSKCKHEVWSSFINVFLTCKKGCVCTQGRPRLSRQCCLLTQKNSWLSSFPKGKFQTYVRDSKKMTKWQ